MVLVRTVAGTAVNVPRRRGGESARVHAHVSRSVVTKRKTAPGLVELKRRKPQVKEDAIVADTGQFAKPAKENLAKAKINEDAEIAFTFDYFL